MFYYYCDECSSFYEIDRKITNCKECGRYTISIITEEVYLAYNKLRNAIHDMAIKTNSDESSLFFMVREVANKDGEICEKIEQSVRNIAANNKRLEQESEVGIIINNQVQARSFMHQCLSDYFDKQEMVKPKLEDYIAEVKKMDPWV